MRLVRLRTHAFRNLVSGEHATDARFVVISGPNAQGKTNLLEAVWVLASLKPLRTHRWQDVVRWGSDEAVISGELRTGSDHRRFRLDVGAGQRRMQIDETAQRDVTDWFEGIRAIAFTPADGEIIADAPAVRRRWLDRAAFTVQPAHLQRVQAVRRVLAQKREVLQADRPDRTLLDVLDEQLAARGAALIEARVRALDELAPHIRELHAGLAQQGQGLSVSYRSEGRGSTVTDRQEALAEALRDRRPDELRRRRCLVGPQRDEVRFQLEGRSARTFGSRGQVRSIVLALKLAELVAARERGDRPLFLLDDLSSELDRGRTERLVALLVDLDAQVWVTTTDPDHLGALPAGEVCHLLASNGEIQRLKP